MAFLNDLYGIETFEDLLRNEENKEYADTYVRPPGTAIREQYQNRDWSTYMYSHDVGGGSARAGMTFRLSEREEQEAASAETQAKQRLEDRKRARMEYEENMLGSIKGRKSHK